MIKMLNQAKAKFKNTFTYRELILTGRWMQLLLEPSLAFSILVGIGCSYLAERTHFGCIKWEDFSQIGFTYASIGFAAAIAGAGFALALPGADRISRWAKIKIYPDRDLDAFSELLFVFTYAAFVQLLLIASCFLAYIFGYSDTISKDPIIVLIISAIMCYSFFELLDIVKTLMQVQHAISKEAQNGI
jgi:hypothetical protein